VLDQLFTSVLVIDRQGTVVDSSGCPLDVRNVFESAVLQPAESHIREALNGFGFETLVDRAEWRLRLRGIPTKDGLILAIDEPPVSDRHGSNGASKAFHRRKTMGEITAGSRLARMDGLTGLGNRLAFQEGLAELRSGTDSFGVIVADIDDFKLLALPEGQPNGDRTLKEVARLLRTCTRQQDTAVRMGADEFAILIPSASVPTLEEIARRIESRIDFVFDPSGSGKISVGVSIGAAHRSDGVGDIYRSACVAMRLRKRARKARQM
jgi:diguanylate cyclase (GGDEF)-like protein